ncbi:MAG: hypothetical protein R3C51_10590 [Parvularculaceae bacterium]
MGLLLFGLIRWRISILCAFGSAYRFIRQKNRETLMPANKTAAEAEPRAVAKKKTTSTKNAAPARKSERRPVTKSVSPKKSATKKTPQKKTQPKKSSTPKPVAKKTSPAKAAAAKAPARPTKGASFDAEKRRKLIAAAAARRRKAVASKRESIKPEIIQHREPTRLSGISTPLEKACALFRRQVCGSRTALIIRSPPHSRCRQTSVPDQE